MLELEERTALVREAPRDIGCDAARDVLSLDGYAALGAALMPADLGAAS